MTDDERVTLEALTARRKTAQALALRARIVLASAEKAEPSNQVVAGHLGVNQATVGKWRRRFVEKRLDGLLDGPRPGAPRTVTDEMVERVVVKTLEETPRDATHWSRASMAKVTGMSKTTVGRICRAVGLKPHLVDNFKLSAAPFFIEKLRDVVGLYLDPPERAVALCVDEKSQIQALNRSQPILRILPSVPERQSHDYKRTSRPPRDAAGPHAGCGQHRRGRVLVARPGGSAVADRGRRCRRQPGTGQDGRGRGPRQAGRARPVDEALAKAAMAGRFSEGDLASVLAYRRNEADGEAKSASEAHSLQPGTSPWEGFGR